MGTKGKHSGLDRNQGYRLQSTEMGPESFSSKRCLSILLLDVLLCLKVRLVHVSSKKPQRASFPNPCLKLNQPRIHPDPREFLCWVCFPLETDICFPCNEAFDPQVPSLRSLATYYVAASKLCFICTGLCLALGVRLSSHNRTFFLELLQCARSSEVCGLSLRSLSFEKIN